MTPETDFLARLLGLPAEVAENMLRAKGFEVVRREYSSRRGVEGADSERVIRVSSIGNNSIEVLVSRFKTTAGGPGR